MENILSVDSISEDIFQCGRCKLAFTSLTMFLDHKREPCALPSWPGLTSGLQCTGVGDEATYAPRLPNSVHASPYELPEPYDDTRLYAPLLTARVPVAADEPNRFACVHCPKTFKRAKSLSLHLKTHTRDRAFQCLVCGRCFVQNTHLQRHVSAHRVWPDGLGRTVPTTPCSPVPSTTYSCAYCDKLLPNYTKFRIHLKTHISEKLFKCIQIDCSELFRELNLLLQHASKFRVTDQVYLDVEREGQPLGRIVIGLFGDLAPRSVKNFKVLATKGIKGKSYKGTRFVRIIKRFMIQGGDIVSNDGKGSISIYGEVYEDENLDTKHAASGFVSMANKGPDTNGCQFFITTIATPWLDHLHTVVGKVVEGQNIVHMIEHTATDVDDRPMQEVVIVNSGILPIKEPFYISDDPYDLWAWIKASAVPLTMSFSVLGFFHWMIKKMEI